MTTMNYNWNELKKIKEIKKWPKKEPVSKWLPITIASEISGYSGQMIRYLILNNTINCMKIRNKIILVNMESLKRYGFKV